MCKLCEKGGAEPPKRRSGLKRNPDTLLATVGHRRREAIHADKSYGVSEQVLRAEWKAIDARKRGSMGPLSTALRSLYESQIKIILKRMREKANLKALAYAAKKPDITPLVVSNLIDWDTWFQRTGDVARPHLRDVIEKGYQTGSERIGVTATDLTSDTPFVRRVLSEIVSQTKRTNATFKDMVTETVQNGLSEGEDMSELVDRVRQKTTEQTGHRLRRTVRTAANGAFEAGQVEAYTDAGINEHRWLSQRDARVRSPTQGDKWNHRDADGQTVTVGISFTIEGRGGRTEQLRFPSAPEGSPSNVIHCRCSTRPVS